MSFLFSALSEKREKPSAEKTGYLMNHERKNVLSGLPSIILQVRKPSIEDGKEK